MLVMKYLMWLATLAGMTGSTFLAANLALEIYGFACFVVCSGILAIYAMKKQEWSLLVLQGFYIVVNGVGLLRFY